MSDIDPVELPPPEECWRRIRLAESILGHRPIVPETTRQELLQVLRGESVTVTESEEVS